MKLRQSISHPVKLLKKNPRKVAPGKCVLVGVKTRKELIDDYGYPAKGKAHSDKYLLFKTAYKYRHKNAVPEDAEPANRLEVKAINEDSFWEAA